MAKPRLHNTRPTASANHLTGKSGVFGKPQDVLARDYLDDPGWIADYIAEDVANSLPGDILPEILAPTGTALYTQTSGDDLKVEGLGHRSEHSEYPIVRFSPTDLKEARTADIGGRFRVSDQAVDANDVSIIGDGITLLQHQIKRTLNDMMLEALAQITGDDGPGTSMITNANWNDFTLVGANPTPERQRPWADIVAGKRLLRDHGLAAKASHLLVDEDTADSLSAIYGAAKIDDTWGLSVGSDPEVPAATGYLISSGGFGRLVTKDGIRVETWRDPSIRATWVQCYVEPAIIITRPTNVVRLIGLDTSI